MRRGLLEHVTLRAMGTLIDRDKRDRARATRATRRRAVLDAAGEVFAAYPLAKVSLELVGERAGAMKGSAALLFPGREELLLELAAEHLRIWAAAVVAELESSRHELDVGGLARLLAHSVAGDELLPRLVALLPVAVESVSDPAAVWRLTTAASEDLDAVQRAALQRCPALPAGAGTPLLVHLFVLVVGLAPLARPAAGMAAALAGPDLAHFNLDLEAELATLLAASMR
jgi:AcrR family transcriptional regulator